MSRQRHRDKNRPGLPPLNRWKPGETWQDRHARRLDFAMACEADVRQWCERIGATLEISNEGHHWKLSRGEQFAEWWPSSAKLVLDRRYRDGWHAHDWRQVVDVLNWNWIEKELSSAG